MTRTLGAVAFLLSSLALAQTVPGSMSFNARLTDTGGAPVTGSHALSFGIYDASTGGAAIWTENVAGATFSTDGVAYVELGATTPLTPAALDGRRLFLEVSVDGTTMSPRLPIVSVPYAIRSSVAASALTVGSLNEAAIQRRVTGTCNTGQAIRTIDAAGGVQCENISSGGGGDVTAVTTAAGSGLAGGATSGDIAISLAPCGAGQVLQSNGTTWACTTPSASGNIPGNAQIGTSLSLPSSRLIVQGPPAVTGTGTLSVSSGSTNTVGASTTFLSEVSVGDYIVCAGQTRKVTAVTSDTALTVDFPWSANILVQAFTYQKGIVEFRDSTGAKVVSIDARGHTAEATPWYALASVTVDFRANAGNIAAGSWITPTGRTVTYTKRLTSSALKITYQDSTGTLGQYYDGCNWRVMLDGAQIAIFSDADADMPATWKMKNSAHLTMVTGLAAGSHTVTIQTRGNRGAWGGGTSECLMGWNQIGSFLMVEEIQ